MTESQVRGLATIHFAQLSRAVDEWPVRPPEWQQAAHLSDVQLTLTPKELTCLCQELLAVIARHSREAPSRHDPGVAESVVLQFQAFRRPV